MKAFFEKHWAVIVFIITALIDTNQGFLESIFQEQWQVVLVRLVGSLILAYKWNPALKFDVNANTDPMNPTPAKKRVE
jgi:hypothetical protein